MNINKGRYRRISIQSAKLDLESLHPAPAVAVPDRNCCDCIFFTASVAIREKDGICNMNGQCVNNYDECGAFSKRIEKSIP